MHYMGGHLRYRTNYQPCFGYFKILQPYVDSTAAQQVIGRAAWVSGDDETAALAINHILPSATPSLLNVVDAFRSDWTNANPILADHVAAHYLLKASQLLKGGDGTQAKRWLVAAAALRSMDLYANYWLLRSMSLQGAQTDQYLQNLWNFAESAILPSSSDLVPFMTRTVPVLVSEGIWSSDQLERVISIWIWKYSRSRAIESMLQSFCDGAAENSKWCRYLGELYYRRNDWGHSEQAYLKALTPSPSDPESALRLRQVKNHARGEQQSSVTPDDAVNEARVADLLQVQPSALNLGTDQMKFGGFEQWADPAFHYEWVWSDMSGSPDFDAALFLGGMDDFLATEGNYSVRIDGLWQRPESGPDPSRAGYWTAKDLELLPGETWALTFSYRTSGSEDKASIWLTAHAGKIPEELFLPGTQGAWHQSTASLVTMVKHLLPSDPYFAIGEQTRYGLIRSLYEGSILRGMDSYQTGLQPGNKLHLRM